MTLFANKNVAFRKRGDKIQVRLLDAAWNVFYDSEEVSLTDRAGMVKLKAALKQYGIDFNKVEGSDWFE